MQSSGIQLSGICFANWVAHCKNSDLEAVQMGMVINQRFRLGDRRQNNVMPNIPFKDSNEATIKKCRRLLPDRRINSTHGEWIKEIVIR